jgi:hypothetical protein
VRVTDASDLRPVDGPPSPLWRAWQATSRANRRLAAAAVALAVGVGGAAVLTGDDDEDEPVRRTTTAAASASPTPSASASPSPVAEASPDTAASTAPAAVPPSAPAPSSASPSPLPAAATPSVTPAAPAVLRLGGDDLGVTRVGAPDADAVRAVSAVLGPPVADPAPTTACVGAGDREVEWADFGLAITDGRVSGWSSTDGRLRTPSGVTIGTTVTELREVYGDRLELHDASPDSGPGFAVRGVELGGALTGPGGDDRVAAFFNRACSPP